MSEPKVDAAKIMGQAKEAGRELIKKATQNTSTFGTITVLMFIVIFFVLYYIYLAVQKREYNCKLIQSYPIQSMDSLTKVLEVPLYNVFVKTAYNCCCTGDFKNDYVDTCALLNCARQGVRALDFTIYSLHGEPVIAASTLNSKKYKEIYNSLNFSKTMTQVKQMFMFDTANCSNVTDPLFLIFRIQSDNLKIYNKIGDALQSIFGVSSSAGNKIYKGSNIENEKIVNLIEKVIIFVDITGLTKFETSNLSLITSMQFGTMTNQIYRETDAYDIIDTGIRPNDSHINILYPDYSAKSTNYDFDTVGIKQYFQFIGLNFQMNDVYLNGYNTFFKSSIMQRPA
jgi:hypothetical protein